MANTANFKIKSSKGKTTQESLHIKSKPKGVSFKTSVGAFKYQDKETNQYIIYIPSFDLSAYGETKQKAEEMIAMAFEDFFHHLSSLSKTSLEQTLRKLGWKHDKLKNKDYSKVYVDLSGELKNFAVNETVTQELISA